LNLKNWNRRKEKEKEKVKVKVEVEEKHKREQGGLPPCLFPGKLFSQVRR